MVELAVTNLVKKYGAVTAIDDVSFTVADGELVTLLGPSGCGKSTTLAAIAGLEHPTTGSIRAGKVDLFHSGRGVALPPEARNCGLVFQAYALWPHMSVQQNVAFPLRLRKVPKAEGDRLVAEVLELVEMSRFASRHPHELSGGQQQRVALARTLVYKPDILLLDEPLSNLDSKLRERARSWLSELHRKVRQTTIYVTHDQTEALALSDRIIVMNGGRVAQIGRPEDVYNDPADAFVADFIGTSAFLAGTVTQVVAGRTAVALPDGQMLLAAANREVPQGAGATVAIRPEQLVVGTGRGEPEAGEGTTLKAPVRARAYMGARYQYDLDVCGQILKVDSLHALDEGELTVWIPATACIAFKA